MFRKFALAIVAIVGVSLVAGEAWARNPAYYGTPRKASAKTYSGIYQAQQPNVVPTFSLPVYNATYYRPRYSYGYPAVYYQPVVVYPPIVYYGF